MTLSISPEAAADAVALLDSADETMTAAARAVRDQIEEANRYDDRKNRPYTITRYAAVAKVEFYVAAYGPGDDGQEVLLAHSRSQVVPLTAFAVPVPSYLTEAT